jgi:hypothetical protein
MNWCTRTLWMLMLFVFVPLYPSQGRELMKTEGRDVAVLCDNSLKFAAGEIIDIYPGIKTELESTFQWPVDFKPLIVLIGEKGSFEQMAGNRSYVAYALPGKQAIVIDYSRMNVKPFTLEVTLKHELTHLILHRHIVKTVLPAWLDEGVAQWISEGIPDLVLPGKASLLSEAAFSGRLLHLESLTRSFPQDSQGLALAYEESRSVVDYIFRNYGKNGILNILEAMRRGTGYREAIEMSLMVPLPELEQRWMRDQKSLPAILTYLAANIYTILFIGAALLTFWAYLRFLLRKRRLASEEDDPEDFPSP